MGRCKLCDKNYNNVKTFNTHIKTCLERFCRVILKTKKVNIKICPVCKQESDTVYQNYAHVIENHTDDIENMLKCKKCGKKYKLEINLRKHEQECGVKVFACEICGKVNYNEREYLKHVDKKHNVNESDDSDDSDDESAMEGAFFIRKWVPSSKKTLLDILSNYKKIIEKVLEKRLLKDTVQFSLNAVVTMKKIDKISGKEEDVEAGFSGGMKVFVSLNSFEELYDDSVKKILSSFDNYVKQGSGLIYGYTKFIILKIARYKLSGGCFVSLPHPYNMRNSIINIKSRNNNCFEVAVLCGLMWKEIPRNNEYKSYKKFLGKKLNFEGCDNEPMVVKDIPKFEEINNLKIHCYQLSRKGGKIRPIHISNRKRGTTVTLLLIRGKLNNHYCTIIDLNYLLKRQEKCSSTKFTKFCPKCLQTFSNQMHFENHHMHCSLKEINSTIKNKLKIPRDEKIMFKDYRYTIPSAIRVYGDFETLNMPIHSCTPNFKAYTEKRTQMEMCSFAYIIKSDYLPPKFVLHRGKDSASLFMVQLQKDVEEYVERIRMSKKTMNEMTSSQIYNHKKCKECYLCKKPFISNAQIRILYHLKNMKRDLEINNLDLNIIPSIQSVKSQRRIFEARKCEFAKDQYDKIITSNKNLQNYIMENQLEYDGKVIKSDLGMAKVRDHCKYSGEFLGSAHSRCNLYRKVNLDKIPVFYHNLSGFDSHLIFDSISQSPNSITCEVIGQNLSNIFSIICGQLQFKDSLKFLPASLDKLSSNLKKKNGPLTSKFPSICDHFQKQFETFDESVFELLTKKQNSPYSYITSFERLNDKNLPDQKYFFNELTKKHISEYEYEIVEHLWDLLGMRY